MSLSAPEPARKRSKSSQSSTRRLANSFCHASVTNCSALRLLARLPRLPRAPLFAFALAAFGLATAASFESDASLLSAPLFCFLLRGLRVLLGDALAARLSFALPLLPLLLRLLLRCGDGCERDTEFDRERALPLRAPRAPRERERERVSIAAAAEEEEEEEADEEADCCCVKSITSSACSETCRSAVRRLPPRFAFDGEGSELSEEAGATDATAALLSPFAADSDFASGAGGATRAAASVHACANVAHSSELTKLAGSSCANAGNNCKNSLDQPQCNDNGKSRSSD